MVLNSISDIISFYGTDGSGKTTIAKEMASLTTDQDCIILGGSNFKSWLTDDVARETLGVNHKLNEYGSGDEERVLFYEDIAVACYGLARIKSNQGSRVLIDSDPYLKRIIWSTLHSPDAHTDYVPKFEQKMIDHIGHTESPDYIIGVNMEQNAATHEQILGRLSLRLTNSEHDPTSVEQVSALDNQAHAVWGEILLANDAKSSVKGFNYRLSSVRTYHTRNPECPPSKITEQAKSIAQDIYHIVALS